ncbi:uncharacterized protein LOC133835752 [Drosophila sulfurigaster albostrigata]|uniref:uncharacterized protein LOC133835752 n=1 Tax=Drosophila sulfurigaster albostrigata TaxID=89887 RepID=UPI002D21D5DD|nr:uncharacterized protein LOC133835752 [Drosophila sulfurigaster albostrigata]
MGFKHHQIIMIMNYTAEASPVSGSEMVGNAESVEMHGTYLSHDPMKMEVNGGQAVIVRSYFPSSEITIRVELTASHMGYFEFRLCPKPSAKQSCLDENLLEIISGSPLVRSTTDLDTRFYPRNGSRIYEIKAQLPEILCNQCVLQWRYVAGNNWGICDDGNGAVGCGPQEEFRSCSDIAITTDARLPIRPARPTTRITTHHQSPKKDQVDANNVSVSPEIFITCLALILLFIGILIWVVYKNYPHRVAEWKQFLLRKLCKKDEVNSSRVIQSPTKAFNTILSIDDIGKSKDNSRGDHLSNLQISITPIPPPRTKRVTRVKENTNI